MYIVYFIINFVFYIVLFLIRTTFHIHSLFHCVIGWGEGGFYKPMGL